jgi:hypothetical protein
MMKELVAFLCLFWSLALAQAQNPNLQVPIPPPIASVDIEDDSIPGAPFKFWGTADVFAKEMNGEMSLWVDDNNLTYQNVSGEDIIFATLEEVKTDVRGVGRVIRHLPAFPADAVTNKHGRKFPDSTYHTPSMSMHTPLADYNLKPFVNASVKIHVVSVTFADGTIWQDVERYGGLRDREKY